MNGSLRRLAAATAITLAALLVLPAQAPASATTPSASTTAPTLSGAKATKSPSKVTTLRKRKAAAIKRCRTKHDTRRATKRCIRRIKKTYNPKIRAAKAAAKNRSTTRGYVRPSVSYSHANCVQTSDNRYRVTYYWKATGGRYTDLGNDGQRRDRVDGGTRTWTSVANMQGWTDTGFAWVGRYISAPGAENNASTWKTIEADRSVTISCPD